MDFVKQIEEKLAKELPAHVFLDDLCLPDEGLRKSSEYNDPRHYPFFYWLGVHFKPKRILEIGFKLGLSTCCFFKSCKTVEDYYAFYETKEEYYSPRLGKKNVKKRFKGDFVLLTTIFPKLNDLLEGQFDLVFINETENYDKYRAYLDLAWERINEKGLIIIDYINRLKPAKQAYVDFCSIQNKSETILDTRYGIGLIQK